MTSISFFNKISAQGQIETNMSRAFLVSSRLSEDCLQSAFLSRFSLEITLFGSTLQPSMLVEGCWSMLHTTCSTEFGRKKKSRANGLLVKLPKKELRPLHLGDHIAGYCKKGMCFTVNIKFGLARLIWMIDEQADDRQEHSSMYGPKY